MNKNSNLNKFLDKMNDWVKKVTLPITKFQEGINEQQKEMARNVKSIMKHEAEKNAQPFITNKILDDLRKSQTPKWIGITSFILLILSLLAALWSLLHSYGLM